MTTNFGNGGNIELNAGQTTSSNANADAGTVTINGGDSSSALGGTIDLNAGDSGGADPGGDILLTGGTPSAGSNGAVLIMPIDVGAGDTGELKFRELTASGTAYVGFKSPDDLTSGAGAQTYVLPPADGNVGEALLTDGSANLSFGVPIGAGRFELSFVDADLQGGQIVDVGDDKFAATATGLANDATVYTATISVDGGGAQAIAVTGSSAQTYATLLTELAADTAGATWTLAGGNLLATSATQGGASAISIVDTDLFSTLTGFISLSSGQFLLAVAHGIATLTGLATKFYHVSVYNQVDELSFIGAVYVVDDDNLQLKLTAAVAADPTPALDGTWTVVVSQ
jgi:hypothetical protein